MSCTLSQHTLLAVYIAILNDKNDDDVDDDDHDDDGDDDDFIRSCDWPASPQLPLADCYNKKLITR